MSKRCSLLATMSVMALAHMATAAAHHSYAAYEGTRTITLDGIVKTFQWTNPHAYIDMLIQQDSASVQWSIEMGSPLVMKNGGWSRNLLKPGDRISAVIHPRRDGVHSGSLVQVTLADGTVKKMNDRAAAAAAEAAEAKGQAGPPPQAVDR